MLEKSYDEMTEQEKDDYGSHFINMSEACWQPCKCKHCGKEWKVDIYLMDKDDLSALNTDECNDYNCIKTAITIKKRKKRG